MNLATHRERQSQCVLRHLFAAVERAVGYRDAPGGRRLYVHDVEPDRQRHNESTGTRGIDHLRGDRVSDQYQRRCVCNLIQYLFIGPIDGRYDASADLRDALCKLIEVGKLHEKPFPEKYYFVHRNYLRYAFLLKEIIPISQQCTSSPH